MNKLFMGLLAVAALALIVTKAIAGAANSNNVANAAADANADNGGVMIIETYSASSVAMPNNASGNNANMPENADDMQPLPGDPGVEVAPLDSSVAQPVVVEEEDVLIQQTEDGE